MVGGRERGRTDAACCPFLASLLCFCCVSFNAGFVAVRRMSAEEGELSKQSGSSVTARCVTVCVSVSACVCVCVCVQTTAPHPRRSWVKCTTSFLTGFLSARVVSHCRCVCERACLRPCVLEPFMVTDSIHLSPPFTVKRQLADEKALLDSFSSSPAHSCC